MNSFILRAAAAPEAVLAAILEELGGPFRIREIGQYYDDPDLAWIAAKGRLFTQVTKYYKGPEALCHWNAGKLYEAGLVNRICIGYAQNSEGWHQHTWGLKAGGVVETTPSNFGNTKWFGVPLNEVQAAGFVAFLKRQKPGQGMVRTTRGGSVRKMG